MLNRFSYSKDFNSSGEIFCTNIYTFNSSDCQCLIYGRNWINSLEFLMTLFVVMTNNVFRTKRRTPTVRLWWSIVFTSRSEVDRLLDANAQNKSHKMPVTEAIYNYRCNWVLNPRSYFRLCRKTRDPKIHIIISQLMFLS